MNTSRQLWLVYLLLWMTVLLGYAQMVYPAQKRGGDVCVCGGAPTLPGSTCTSALLRNQPLRLTPLTSHFVDVDSSLGTVSSGTAVTTTLAGSVLKPIVLEIVAKDEQEVAEQVGSASTEFSSQVMGVTKMVSLQGSAAVVTSITIAATDDTTAGVTATSSVVGSTVALQDGMFAISDLRLFASSLATGGAVRVCLNVTVSFNSAHVGDSTSGGALWILLEAVEIRNSPLVGNSSTLFFPTFLHFPPLYSPILETSWSTAQSLFGAEEVVMDAPMDDLTVYVKDVTEQITTSLDGHVMKVDAFYTSSGGEVDGLTGTKEVTISQGKATFSGLGFDNTTTSRSGIALTFSVPTSSSTQEVVSPSLVAVNVPVFAFRLRFSAGSFLQFDLNSYENVIQTLGSPVAPAFKAVLGVALPIVEVQVVDSSGNIDTNTEAGLFIVAKCVGAVLESWSAVAPVQKGEARFTGLTFSSFPAGVSATQRSVVITFQLSTVADPTSTVSSARLILSSPIIAVYDPAAPRTPSQMRFSTDRVNAALPIQQGGVLLITVGSQLQQSVRVSVLAEDGWPVSLAGVEVGLELSGGDRVGAALAGTLRVSAATGLAEFNDVAVIGTAGSVLCTASNATACPPVVFKATLYNSGTSVQPLLSSSIYAVHKSTSSAATTSTSIDTDDTTAKDVQGVRSRVAMRFEPAGSSLFTAEDQTSFATVRVTVPPIAIEVLDSNGAVDTSANSLTILASAGSVPLNGAVATTLKGRAIFPSLLFADSGAAVLTFTCQATRNGDLVEGTTLTTGTIVVEAVVAPTYGLKFHRDSSVQGESDRVFGSVGYPLPLIGVTVVDSSHAISDASASVVDIVASIPAALFDPSSTVRVPVVNGVAWFSNLVVSWVSSGAVSRAITFRAEVNSSRAQTQTVTSGTASVAVRDQMAYVHRKKITTGPVVFVDPSEITALEVVPYTVTAIPLQENAPPASATPTAVSNTTANGTQYAVQGVSANTYFSTRAGGSLYQSIFPAAVGFSGAEIAAAFSTAAAAPRGSVVEVSLWMRNAASRLTLPPDATQQNVTLSTSGMTLTVGSGSVVFPVDPRPAPMTTSIRATFSDLSFIAERYVVGQYATITFTAPDSKVGTVLRERPLLVSPIVVEGSSPDGVPDVKVIVVEVLDGGTSFSADTWAANLALTMNIPKRRIELMKVRDGGSASSDYNRVWSGTRILLQFQPPTPQDTEKLSSNQLTQLLLSLNPASCGSVAPLKMRRKLLLKDDTECDLYLLDEQRRAAQRCVSTSGPGDRCTCHVPMFEAMGQACKKTSQMLAVCATLRACGRHAAINDPCFELTYLIYLQYALIGVYALLFLLVVYLVYLWRSGYFSKMNRRKLGDVTRGDTTSSLKMITGEEDPNAMII